MDKDFNDIYSAYNPLVTQSIKKYLSRHRVHKEDIQDACQEVWIKIINTLRTNKDIDNLSTFISVLIRNSVIDYVRTFKSKRKNDVQTLELPNYDYEYAKDDIEAAVASINNNPEIINIKREVEEDILSVIDQALPAALKQAETLKKYIKNNRPKYKDLATELDSTEDDIKVRIFRAKKKIKEFFKQNPELEFKYQQYIT